MRNYFLNDTHVQTLCMTYIAFTRLDIETFILITLYVNYKTQNQKSNWQYNVGRCAQRKMYSRAAAACKDWKPYF